MTTNSSAPGQAQPATGAGTLSARSAGVRLGALFGPAIFGVTAAGVALPDVAAALHATPGGAAWVLTAHALALGVGTALSGRLSDTWGIRTTLLAGTVALLLGALICLTAPNLGTLVAGRFVLAAGSGAMSSSALALAASSEPASRPRILAIFGATMALFSAGATLAGGLVTEWMHWRGALILPALSVLAVPFCLRQAAARPGTGKAPDLTGAALLTVTAASFLLLVQSSALELGTTLTVGIAALLVLGAVGLALRIAREPDGFVPRELATNAAFLRAAVVGAGVYAGLFGAMYAVPQALVGSHGWSVLAVGLWLLPGAVVGAVLSRFASRFTTGSRGNLLLAGTATAAAVVLGLTGLTSGGPALIVTGASLGFASFAVTQVVTTGLLSGLIEPMRRGGAIALLNLTFFVGGGIGSAVAGALAKSYALTTVLGLIALLPLLGALVALTLPRPAVQMGPAR
ncbi:MFS transporter [Streptomyces albus]|uniref:MFS transporter n=1 Tax=Streptomyces albus TaxID=1888 RepID=UPI00340C233D